MPSYHWRETAVVLIYSMGYPFSFMRMPHARAPAERGNFSCQAAIFVVYLRCSFL
jgi:hypothetical protein